MVPDLGQPIGGGQGIGRWHRLRTINQLTEAIPYGQVQFLQLDTNLLEANLGFYAWNGFEILFGQSSAPLQVQGNRSPGFVNFNFSLSSHTDCRIAQGYRVSHLTVGGLHPDWKINMVLPAQMVYASLRISRQLLRNYLAAMQRFDLEQVLQDHHFLHLPQTLPPVIAYLKQVRQALLEQPEILRSPQQAQLLLDDLVPLLVNTIPPGGQASSSPVSSLARYQLVREALVVPCV